MHTAHKTDNEKKEHFDSPDELDSKIQALAKQIKASKHFVVFTGAGISTSAGIPDFRSGVDTVLPTGPGCWEQAATGTTKKPVFRRPVESAIPTPCHMALVKLQEAGYLKFLISQNCDGLHRKSGFPATKLAELHGNQNLEVCRNSACRKEYLRDYDTCTSDSVHEHRTGNKCENCGEELYDTIINFGENLPKKELVNGFDNSEKADLCLVLGSSLRVTPAAKMPCRTVEKGGELVIVNLQETPLDKHAVRVNGMIDEVITRLMAKLNLEIPRFLLKRRVMIMKTEGRMGKEELYIRGVDETGSPYSILTGLKVTFSESKEKIVGKGEEPYQVNPRKSRLDEGSVEIEMTFQGHYGEPSLALTVPLKDLVLNKPIYYLMEFDPEPQEWVSNARIAI